MILKNNYTLQEDQKRVILEPIPPPRKPLRITVSRIGKTLGKSNYSTIVVYYAKIL